MLKRILIAAIIIVGGLVGYIASQPSSYSVTRTATIAAPPADVFMLVNDFHKWNDWSPWAKLDPAMKTTFEGAPVGNGAVYTWVGNKDVGEGRMTILDSRPSDMIRIKLDFIKPFESTSSNEFKFASAGAGTTVTWNMAGDNNFMSKAYMAFAGSMDKMIGPDFEKGLAQMKALAEAAKK